jgi:phenylacetate-CoA ligase
MVKLRGTNIFPEAIGAIVSETRESNGEYVCIVELGAQGQEEMSVRVELIDPNSAPGKIETALSERLKMSLGVKIKVEACAPGSLSALTGLKDSSKVRRLIDKRPKV